MIEIYDPGNNRFDLNGDMVLLPTVCDIDVSLDSVWSLEINHPIDAEGRWKHIVNNAVIEVNAFKLTSNERQLYRIRKVDVSDSGVHALAKPIWMDAQNEVFLVDTRPTNKTGQEALDIILRSNSKYKGRSDIQRKSTAYYVLKNAAEAVMGNDNSFLERWGGEVLYDNYTIIINDRVGDDYGFEIVYGKNILQDGLKETIEMDDVVTRIVPKAYNGYTLAGNSPWVDSPLINSYPTIRTKVMEFPHVILESDVTSDETEGLIICPTIQNLRLKLEQEARKEFDKGIDKPKITIQCKLASIENTEAYKEYKDLFKLGLGDTVHCRHNKLGIVTNARVRSVKWDCIKEVVKDITIGDEYRSFVERVSTSVGATEKALTKAGSVKASRVSGTVDMGNAQLKYQKNIAKKQNVRAILFEDLDPQSETYGAMCLGSLGFEIANTRTEDDRDWVWTTFGTAKGFTANLINAGTLEAINIHGSYISGGNIEGTTIKGSTIEGNAIKGGSIYGTEIEGGMLRGATIEGNVINGSTINGGNIEGTNITGTNITGGTITGSKVLTRREHQETLPIGPSITETYNVVDESVLYDGFLKQSTTWTSVSSSTKMSTEINTTSSSNGYGGLNLLTKSQPTGLTGTTDILGGSIVLNNANSIGGSSTFSVSIDWMAGIRYTDSTNISSATMNCTDGFNHFSGSDAGSISAGGVYSSGPLNTKRQRYGAITGTNISKDVPTGGSAWTNVGSIKLPAGYWLIMVAATFPSNATGRRGLAISTTNTGSGFSAHVTDHRTAVNGAATICKVQGFTSTTGTTTYYFNAVQTSGATQNVTVRYSALYLGHSSDALS